jgi:GNAT superfamily N-acetyltransferase
VPAIGVVDPVDPRVPGALTAYLTEVLHACGLNGLSVGEAAADVGEYRPPSGVFLLATDPAGAALGCAAVRTISAGIGEVKRMWVHPSARGQGLGARLLAVVEREAVGLGLASLRLDTNHALRAAIALYERHGYVPIARYNDHRDATHFFEKRLAAGGEAVAGS